MSSRRPKQTEGRRTSRIAGGTTTNFLYDGGKILLEKQGSTTSATYTYGNALIRKDGETPLFDGQGSERTVTNSSQTVTGTLTLDGFGNQVASTGSSANPYMYAAMSGYRNDGDAGLSHVGARYYDAQVGRFISRDTKLDEQPYLYGDHDPINYTDANGHQKQDKDKKKHPKPIPKKIPYPFKGIKEIQISSGLQGGLNLGFTLTGNSSDVVVVDLKNFWDNQTPFVDQQNLVHHSREDYLKYLREHVHYSNPKISKP